MNERIQQLAEQAGEYVNAVYTPPVRSKTPGKIWEDGHIGWNEQFKEKFAQLIVEECVQAIQNEGQTYKHLDAGEFQANNFSQAVKQHFGVEE